MHIIFNNYCVASIFYKVSQKIRKKATPSIVQSASQLPSNRNTPVL